MTKPPPLPLRHRPAVTEAEALRGWGNLLALWRLCAKPACRQARACRGDAVSCFSRHFVLLPEGVYGWFAGVAEAQQAGATFEEAMSVLNVTLEGEVFREWHAVVAASLGEVACLPPEWWKQA